MVQKERGVSSMLLPLGCADKLAEEAVYHNDIREDLLALASQDGLHAYDFPRKQGWDPFDKTSFLPSQKAWRGGDKIHWHTIADNILNRFEAKGYEGPKNKVGWMRFGHKIVLDQDNHPVRDFRDIPATLSSAVEPWLLEAISRIDRRIWRVDVRARMPWTYTDERGKSKNLCTLSAIGNRTMRFREMYGLVAWTPKAGSELWKSKVLSEMTPVQIANNTTEGLRTFTRTEIKKALAGNKGKYLERAGNSRISDKARRGRKKKARTKKKISSDSKSATTRSTKSKLARKHADEIVQDAGDRVLPRQHDATPNQFAIVKPNAHAPHATGLNQHYVAAMQAADAHHSHDLALSRYPDRLPQKRGRDPGEY